MLKAVVTSMLDFKYCPLCASDLSVTLLPTEDRPRLVCDSCGYIHYINPKVVSGTLPVRDGKVWLLRRGIEPRIGYWTHPAGYQEWGESTEDAAVREAHEEIGCRVEIERLLGVYSRPDAPVVNVIYMARFSGPDELPSLTPEATAVAAFGPDEIPWNDLAFLSTIAALRDWVAQAQSQR